MVALLAIEKASVVAAPRSTFTHPEEWIDAFFGDTMYTPINYSRSGYMWLSNGKCSIKVDLQ